MSNHDFNFETIASPEGKILIEEKVTTSIPYRIKEFEVQTTSNCNGRNHKISVSIGNNNIIETILTDCKILRKELNIQVSAGEKYIKFIGEGFEQKELVKGKGTINYNFS